MRKDNEEKESPLCAPAVALRNAQERPENHDEQDNSERKERAGIVRLVEKEERHFVLKIVGLVKELDELKFDKPNYELLMWR